MTHSTDRKFIRRYKSWLTQYNKLDDCWFRSEDATWRQWLNTELEQLRNDPTLPFVERLPTGFRWPIKMFRNAFQPTYADLASHLNADDDLTIFTRNRSSSDGVVLMLADIDNKAGTGDPQTAAEAFVRQNGLSAYIEPSTHLKGRHVYFLMDVSVTGVTFNSGRSDVYDVLSQWSDRIKADPIWTDCGVKWDGIYGLPTLWSKDDQKFVLSKRGNALKLPRLLSGESDLDKLKALIPVSFESLISTSSGRVLPKTDSSKCSSVCCKEDSASGPTVNVGSTAAEGWQKKKNCVSRLLIESDGTVTLEAVLADYEANWNPSGFSPADRNRRLKDLTACLESMKQTFRPKNDPRLFPFKRDQFLPTIEAIVPVTDFVWDRRELINHRRLSDFVSLKIADAFYTEGDFASTCRNTTISNSRTLKENGTIDWIVGPNVYTKLLAISVKHDLLEVFEEFQRPIRDSRTGKKLANGSARTIGPGKALQSVRDKWLPLYMASKTVKPSQWLKIA